MTLSRVLFVLVPLAGVAVGGSALAQRAERPSPHARSPGSSPYERTTRIDISDGETVEGESISPGSELISTRLPPRHPSLIRVRAHFVAEMLKSAENL